MGANYNLLISFTAGMGGLLFGYEIGVIGQVLALDAFVSRFGTDDPNNNAWVASMFQFGCVFGAAVFSVLADTLGRKRSILVSGITFAVGGALQAGANAIALLLVGRAVSGFAIGIASMVVPVYLAETAPAATRGTITTIYQLMITFGILIASIVNTIIIDNTGGSNGSKDYPWRIAMGAQIVPSVLLVILVAFIPYSPRWLAEKKRHDEGLETIAKLRGHTTSDQGVIDEYSLIRANAEADAAVGNASWGELFSGSNGRRVGIAMVNQALQQLTGINIILYFGPYLYKNLGFNAKTSNEIMPIVFNIVNFTKGLTLEEIGEVFGDKPVRNMEAAVLKPSSNFMVSASR
ncbi:general substrate transporter [Chytriomyces sp. MP71]|nr:general substrate transporter [Chytriomyces sp. MP71]